MTTIIISLLSIFCVTLIIKNFFLKKAIKKSLENTKVALEAASNWKKSSDNYKKTLEIISNDLQKTIEMNDNIMSKLKSETLYEDNVVNAKNTDKINLDDILDKIKTVGFDSLSDTEKNFLKRF